MYSEIDHLYPYSVAHNIHRYTWKLWDGMVVTLECSTTHYVLILLLLVVSEVLIKKNWKCDLKKT